MKTTKLLTVVLVSCFALGIGLSLVIPADVTAGNGGCNTQCSKVFRCGMMAPGPVGGQYPCPEGLTPVVRCYLQAGRVCGGDPPLSWYNCGCTQIGCEMPC